MIKRHLTLWITAATLSIGQARAQQPGLPPPLSPPSAPAAPAAPPPPPAPPKAVEPPAPGHREGRRPARREEMASFLGVAVEPIPAWLGDQLNLPAGFGLVVTYVTPGGPAEVAGLKPHDILKQVNEQVLANPEQLTALIQSFPEGTDVSLDVLRKGQDTKLTAKLAKRTERDREEGSRRREDQERDRQEDPRGDWEDEDADTDRRAFPGGMTPEIQEMQKEAVREAARYGREAAEEARKNARQFQLQREIMILRDKDGQFISTTKMDLSRGRILIRDDQGELEIKGEGDHRTVVAKDPQGKEIYHGSVKDAPPGMMERATKMGDSLKIQPPAPPRVPSPSAGDEDDAESAPSPVPPPPTPGN